MRFTAILVSSALVTLLACSGSTAEFTNASDDGGADSGVSNEQAVTDAANAYCARAAACAPAYITIAYGTTSECVTRLAASLAVSLTANGSTETAAFAEGCAAALPATSCADLLGRNLPAACTTPPGTLADGTACASDSQCKNGKCHLPVNAVCGTCGGPAAAGSACQVDDDCANGQHCGTAGTCVAYGASGDSCDASHPCNPVYGCVAGTCSTPGAVGAACATSDACDELHGVFCSAPHCVSVAFAPTAAACGAVSGALTLCTGPGSDCQGVAAPTYQGTCAAAAADGASCDATNGPMCESPAVCVNGTCTLADPTKCQ